MSPHTKFGRTKNANNHILRLVRVPSHTPKIKLSTNLTWVSIKGISDIRSHIFLFLFPFFIPLLYSVTPWVLVILWEKC